MTGPQTAEEFLAAARKAGHRLSARDTRVNGHLKFVVSCSCGWSVGARSRKKAHSTLVWHVEKVLGEKVSA